MYIFYLFKNITIFVPIRITMNLNLVGYRINVCYLTRSVLNIFKGEIIDERF